MVDQSIDFKEKAKTMEGLRAGRRTKGQVARHEIHLEIEDVQDTKKNKGDKIKPDCLKKNWEKLCKFVWQKSLFLKGGWMGGWLDGRL